MRPLVLSLLFLVACDLPADPQRVVATVEVSVPLDDETSIELFQGRGDTVIVGQETDAVVLRVTLLGPADPSDDEAAFAALRVDAVDDGTRIVAESGIDAQAPRYGLQTELIVPVGFGIDLEDGSGDLSIRNVGTLRVRDDSGDLFASRITGDVSIDDGSGDLELNEVVGNVAISDGSGVLRVASVVGDVAIVDDSGDVFVHDVAGDVFVNDASGDVDLSEITGTATVTDGSGDIWAPGVDLVVLADTSGTVR
ncbi:MAG: DUF4097 family beta strand repeat-containing protein [Myxococcota bacterium]